MRTLAIAMLLLTLILLFGFGATAQIPGTPSVPNSGTGPTDPRELEAFVDGIWSATGVEHGIPSAVVTVVKDGAIFFSKGYGYADLDKKTAASPSTTLYRIGSVTKLFTATAAMQLVEQGKLRLDASVNDLLTEYGAPFRIQERFAPPIRLVDLQQHTAGLDERGIGMASWSAEACTPLAQVMAKRLPPQTMPPRDTISYSNNGVGLEGYLIELASGESYAEYIAKHVTGPLGMNRTGMDPSDALKTDLATGYTSALGEPSPSRYMFLNIPAAGEMFSTAEDMARFMIAHLHRGEFNGVRILSAETADEMHRMHFKQDDRLAGGMAIQFLRTKMNEQTYLWHNGQISGFVSHLFLLPDRDLGVFMACNVEDDLFPSETAKAFMDRYFPVDRSAPKPPDDFAPRAGKYTGFYRLNRYAHASVEKLPMLFADIPLTFDGKGALLFPDRRGAPVRLVELSPNLFWTSKHGSSVVFRTDESGTVTHLLMDFAALEKLKWYEIGQLHQLFIAGTLLLFMTAAVGWPVRAIARWVRREKREEPQRKIPAHCAAVAWIETSLSCFFLIGLGVVLLGSAQTELVVGMPPTLIAMLCIPPVLVVGAMGTALLALALWWKRRGSLLGRVYYTMIALDAVALIPFLFYWNLIGFNW